MAMRDRPDDVLRAERGVTAEKHSRMRRAHGLGIDLRHVHLSNSMPQSRSIQGNAFSWPTATSTSSQLMVSSASPDGTRERLPLASYSAFTFWKVTPVSLPFLCTKAIGTMKLRIGISSCMAS